MLVYERRIIQILFINILNFLTSMKQNVLNFKNDIKTEVAYCKEHGDHRKWMHPIYCAYYILKHDIDDNEAFINDEIQKSHKSLTGDRVYYFKRSVQKSLEKYAEITRIS
jgi:hypothetical protein